MKPDYKARVFNYLTKISYGKVVTYQDIAIFLGNKNLSRVVGNILHSNKDYVKYPCYKVVNSQGRLSSHYAFKGIKGQKELLQKEGIEVKDNRVDLKKYRFKPTGSLNAL